MFTIGSYKSTSDPRHPDSELLRFEFTNHRQEILNSCAHNEPGITSILRSNSDKRALVRSSGNMKNAPAANSLEFGWIDPPPSNDDLLVVKVEQYMICL